MVILEDEGLVGGEQFLQFKLVIEVARELEFIFVFGVRGQRW